MNHEMHDAATDSNGSKQKSGSAAPSGRKIVGNARACETSEIKKWAQELRLDKPLPRGLLPLLAKDDAKQMEIVLKNMSLDRRQT
jgi:hypothetical protein